MKKTKMRVIDAFCTLASSLEDSSLQPNAIEHCDKEMKLVQQYLTCTHDEVVMFTLIFAIGTTRKHAANYDSIARYLNCNPMEILRRKYIIDALIDKDLVFSLQSWNRDQHGSYNDVVLTVNPQVSDCILDNRPIVIEKEKENEIVDNYDFVKYISMLVTERDANGLSTRSLFKDIADFEKLHTELPFVTLIRNEYPDVECRTIFYIFCNDFIYDRNSRSDINSTLNSVYEFMRDGIKVVRKLINGTHPLIVNDLIALSTSGFVSGASVELTDKGKEVFLGEDSTIYQKRMNDDTLIVPEKIKEKQLFYSPDLEKRLSLFQHSLEDESLKKMQAKMDEMGFSKGICTLFYGTPGTGKTETVYQLAKATGRAIFQVDISQTKSCWFGESEKIIKKVFKDYKKFAKKSDTTPILLFNEADAILSTRKTNTNHNTSQTENAIQNIILQEMEDLDGIMIATTNLATNFDAAFERRFLFKIKFDKPTTKAKASIWKNKWDCLTNDEADMLALRYDFSGGEIDNIVRKATMSEIISGKKPTIEELCEMCDNERLEKGKTAIMGFRNVGTGLRNDKTAC